MTSLHIMCSCLTLQCYSFLTLNDIILVLGNEIFYHLTVFMLLCFLTSDQLWDVEKPREWKRLRDEHHV